MTCDLCGSLPTEQEVTYTIELDGKWIIIEHVPAKVCPQCCEKLFSAGTVQPLQHTAWDQKASCRVLETLIFDFSAS